MAAGRGDKVAFHWEGEPGDTRTITYGELLAEVARFANVLRGLGVERGDRVAIYMPMIPELPVAMLACTRIGAAHSVVFGGFSADALRDRILDAQAKVVITADGGWRRGAPVPLKPQVDAATWRDAVRRARGGGPADPTRRRPHRRWRRRPVLNGDGAPADDRRPRPLVARARLGRGPRRRGSAGRRRCEPEHMDAEDLLFLLYTSGTTAAPKGIMHTTGGYLTQVAYTHRAVFDLHPDTDVYWCAADIGWVTGHSYIVYGPLANGATSVMYEGTPDFPDRDRWWSIIERYGVTILYCAPTAIRTFMKWGTEYPDRHDLSTLRVLGTVGEPINPEAWMWYQTTIGGGRCPVVDTWWQTETGAIMISPAARHHRHQAGLGHLPAARRQCRGGRRVGPPGGAGRRLPHPHRAVAVHAARHLRRPGALPADLLEPVRRTGTSPATGPRSTTTATSGCSAGSTT